MSSDLAMAARLTRDLPGFLSAPVTTEQAAETVKYRLRRRPELFLEMAERTIFGNPRSPYLRLLRAVGCQLGDLQTLVRREGVEGALSSLADQGVHVGLEEFKGRREIVRGSERFTVAERDFHHPSIAAHFEVQTSGSRGSGTSVRLSLDGVTDRALATALALDAHGLSGTDHVVWMTGPIYPLVYARLGRSPIAWYYPVRSTSWRVNAGSLYLVYLSRIAGRALPKPAFQDIQDSVKMATWLAARLNRHRPVCVTTRPSAAVRTARAAQEMGLSLEGMVFILGGEPYTQAANRMLESVGARALVRYAFWEGAIVGYSCALPDSCDDVHLLVDRHAVIQHPRRVGDSDAWVDSFLFTSLLSNAAKIMLNVENGDHGTLTRRSCGCPLQNLGLRDHMSQIRSHEKLTSEGMTFVKTDLVRILEEVLPARFGGTSVDYQLLEEEDGGGILRLWLLVGPGAGTIDEAQLIQTFLAELQRGGMLEEYMARVWERAGTVQIKRQPPIPNRGGKVLPFHLVKQGR